MLNPMRRAEFTMTEQQARDFLMETRLLHLALTRPDGAPVLRTLNAAITPEWILIHGAPSGEKVQCIGRPAVAQVEETVALIPSYFLDPERACPATTFFRSVQVHGTLERIDDPHLKGQALQQIMERFQPEGGHTPISFDTPMYQNAIRGVLILGIRIASITGKAKLGQNKKPDEARKLMDQLWLRGATGDAAAIRLMFDYHPHDARPPRFSGPAGEWLYPDLTATERSTALRMLAARGNERMARDAIAGARHGAPAWVGAYDASGELVAVACAVSDGVRHAVISDIAVADGHGQGPVAAALMELLLDHPALRGAREVRLDTATPQFYRRFGFHEDASESSHAPNSTLVFRRDAAHVAHRAPQFRPSAS